MIDVSTSAHFVGDCRDLLKLLPDGCVQTCVTSPPYWGLRDYGHAGQIGLESSPAEYVAKLVAVFAEVSRVLAEDGTLWLNLGDSYSESGRGGNVGGRSTLEGSQSAQDANAKTRKRGSTKSAGKHEHARNASAVSRAWSGSVPGLKPKDLVGIPWSVAFALRDAGWYLRSDIIWHKPNPMPESVRDRPTKSHEYLFLLSKSERYYYDADAIAEPLESDPSRWGRHTGKDPGLQATRPRAMFGADRSDRDGTEWGDGKHRNRRSVWTVATQPYAEAHFATFPPKLIEPCILAGSRVGDLVLDPFFGSGTTGMVAEKHGRRWIGFDLGYEDLAKARTSQRSLVLP